MVKTVLKYVLCVSLVLVLFPPLSSFANDEATETVLIDLKNVNVGTDNTYTHEIEAPKNFGALIDYTFNVTGNSKARLIKVEHIQASNKLKLTFEVADGGVTTVKGYVNNNKSQYHQYLGHAVCRYSDGVRWQVNHYNEKNQIIYDIYDFSKQARGTLPYDFYFNKITAKGKFTADMSITPAYWVDAKGTVYNNAQIVAGTKTVVENEIEYPNNLNVVRLPFSEKSETNKNVIGPYQYFKFLMADFTNMNDKYDGTFIVYPYVAEANKKMQGYATCTQYSFKVFYNFTAKAKANDILGTFTYRYEKSEEPKIITTITADPTQVKFNNENIQVKVTLKAEIVNVKNAAAINKYKLYLRTEDNTQNPKPDGYELPGKSFTAEVVETFTIPKSKLNDKQDYTEYFVGRAYGYVFNSTIMSDLVKASTYVYKDKPVVTEEVAHEIKAFINGNDPVKLGDDTTFNAYGSYSIGSTIEGIRWILPEAVEQPSESYEPGQYTYTTWYDKLGRQRAVVYVIDKEGRQAGAYMDFDVVAPTIETYIKHTGTLKENRKVTFIASHDTPTRYPLTSVTWKVQSIDGTLNSYIRHDGHLSGKNAIDVLFKKAGEYIVTVNSANSAGYTYETTYVVEILEDKKPQVDFDLQQKVYRDPENQNLATIELIDYSYSYDGDYIKQRNWYVIFDSNNDGVFNESRVLFNTGNNTEVSYTTNHVGKYKFILEAIEEFGEPTIDAYVTESDRRRMSTEEW